MIDLTKPWPLGLSRRNWPIFLVAVLVILAALAVIDESASRGAIGWPEAWRAPFFFITDYGLSEWVLIPSLVIMILARLAMFPLKGFSRSISAETAWVSAFIFFGVAIPGLLTNLLKRLIGRGRPAVYEEVGPFSFQNIFNDWTFQSFPSGHSATALGVAFTIGFIWPRTFLPLLIIGLVVAVSRVPVGMHYPTDVFAGCIVGMLGAYLVRNLFAKKRWLFHQQPDGKIVRKPLVAYRQLLQRDRA
jgi:membrane-associated phospholipid phosphatase